LRAKADEYKGRQRRRINAGCLPPPSNRQRLQGGFLVRLRFRKLPGIGRVAPVALLNVLQPEQNTKLYRSYCQNGAAAAVTRHRGKSPRQAALFSVGAIGQPVRNVRFIGARPCRTNRVTASARLNQTLCCARRTRPILRCMRRRAFRLNTPGSCCWRSHGATKSDYTLRDLRRRAFVRLVGEHKLAGGTCGPAAAPAINHAGPEPLRMLCSELQFRFILNGRVALAVSAYARLS
jgi:hypothetical protein